MREIPDQDPVGRQREPEGTIDEASLDRASRSASPVHHLDLRSKVTSPPAASRPTTSREAQYFYEQNRQRGVAPWGRMECAAAEVSAHVRPC